MRVTLASLRSSVLDPEFNLGKISESLEIARESGARLLLLPECMATGHANSPKATEHAERLPDGPICRQLQEWSREYHLAICCGLVELERRVYYNSQVVFDRGVYLGAQRKINLSGDENWHFCAGTRLERFEIDGLRLGITICFDNQFPELALLHARHGVDVIMAPHAVRDTGSWPRDMVERAFGKDADLGKDREAADYTRERVRKLQDLFSIVHRARSYDHNVYSLVCNSVGPPPPRGLMPWIITTSARSSPPRRMGLSLSNMTAACSRKAGRQWKSGKKPSRKIAPQAAPGSGRALMRY